MLGRAWLAISIGLGLLAAVVQELSLLLVAVLFFLTSGIARLWAYHALEKVGYRRRLSTDRAFFGETITLEVKIENLKFLPLPWLRVQDEIPEMLKLEKGRISHSYRPNRALLLNNLSLGWYHRVTRRYQLQCSGRGSFLFGPASVRTSDIFGFFEQDLTIDDEDHLLVYPKVLPLEALGIPSRDPFGDMRVRRHIFEDPVRVAATREYISGDPMRRIHWRSTAKLGRLQSRVFERTTGQNLALFLDTTTMAPTRFGLDPQLLETVVMVAASVASHAIGKGYQLGTFVNERYPLTSRMMRRAPSDNPDQLRRILEDLAQVRGLPYMLPEQMLNGEGRSLPWATTMVVITPMPTDAVILALKRYQRAGRRVCLVTVGDEALNSEVAGLLVYHISDQISWTEMESLRLGR